MKFLRVIHYSFWLVWQVVVAAIDVVHDTLRPHQKQQSVPIGLPLHVMSNLEATLFAESITTTLGTLARGACETDAGRLFIIHAIFGIDLDALYDFLYDMEERLVPSLRDVPRPKASVFEKYSADKSIDPDTAVNVAAEVDHSLPLPDGIAPKGEDKGARSWMTH